MQCKKNLSPGLSQAYTKVTTSEMTCKFLSSVPAEELL